MHTYDLSYSIYKNENVLVRFVDVQRYSHIFNMSFTIRFKNISFHPTAKGSVVVDYMLDLDEDFAPDTLIKHEQTHINDNSDFLGELQIRPNSVTVGG